MERRFWIFVGLVVGAALCLGLGVSLAHAALNGSGATGGASLWQSVPLVVPEPTTVAFVGIGLAGLLLLRRRPR
jgi:membrane protein implicated in regulation of membrane protease activity